MKSMTLNKLAVFGALLAGLAGMTAVPAFAQVEQCTGPQPTTCVTLNAGGSSAATPFMTQVPLNLLDQAPNFPIHYINGDIASPVISHGKLHVWTGSRAGVPTIIRYSATGSSDGILKLQNATSDTAHSYMHFLDHLASTCATGPTLLTRVADGKQYYEYTGCDTIVAGDLPVTLGAADVAGSSFHQVGPITVTVKPLDQSMLTSNQAAIVPWSIVVGEHVKRNIGGVLTPVTGLSRLEIEAIFSRNVTDWTRLGLVTDVTTPGTPDASSPITLCLRQAGSGSKAGFDVTTMKDANETPSGSTVLTNAADGVYFGQSTQDVQDCLRGNAGLGRPAHPRGIGYVDADAVPATAPGYQVKINGYLPNDPSLADPKMNIRCGKYLYWAGERLNVRNYADAGITAAMDALNTDFITNSSSAATVALLPAGAYWVAGADMYVSKNSDGGPVLWKVGAHPCAE